MSRLSYLNRLKIATGWTDLFKGSFRLRGWNLPSPLYCFTQF